MIYGICIFVFYPEYFTTIYPLVRDVYLLLKAPALALFVTSATALWVGAAMMVLALQSRQRKLDAASFVLLAASFGFAIAFFVQHKGWGYHAYPMVALGLLAVACAISAIDHERTSSRRLGVAAVVVVVAMFVKACMWFNASVDVRQIEAKRRGSHRSSDGADASRDMGFATGGALGAGNSPPIPARREHRSSNSGSPGGLRCA